MAAMLNILVVDSVPYSVMNDQGYNDDEAYQRVPEEMFKVMFSVSPTPQYGLVQFIQLFHSQCI